ncbi:threonine--tRNA ligase [Mycoplasma bradburyae]|uniref:threonine--tRNA ligase n=1 Tax=Mycoplasma bradburyae TaxID=2963128 RepID=UPI002342417F|nr:threonine--tRNA ligase [Mycoplasma bradburyae]MDC4184334.1 threonine--tRNA ligase [Mycoplasma bradburyae]
MLNYFNTALLMLQIVLKKQDEAIKFGQLQVNDQGFYLDYLSETIKINPEDFNKLIKSLTKLTSSAKTIKTLEVDKQKANELLINQPHLLELINESNEELVNLAIVDEEYYYLPIKGLLDNTKLVKAFNFQSVGGAYFKGDKDNVVMVRLNGFGFENDKVMQDYLAVIEEQRQRDHRRINKILELFTFNPLAGPGMPIWLPNGQIVRQLIGDYVHSVQKKFGFSFVNTPVLGSVDLYKKSGHYAHYSKDMFPEMKLLDGDSMMLRPMTCPHHCLVYLNKPRQYDELPMRLSEDALLHRYEASGGLTGLERVRAMMLLDNHIFCRLDQIKSEILNSYNVIKEVINTFNLKFHRIDLSLHDPNDKEGFIDNPEMWKRSEKQLEDALIDLDLKYTKQVGEAAFYGPKIDFQVKTALNKIITVSTIQLDFSLPSPEKFDIKYKNKNNEYEQGVIIHLGIIGTYERFVATLLEQTKGALDLWLAPKQATIIPVNNSVHLEGCNKLAKILEGYDLRISVDSRDERLNKKIRDAQINKIPVQIIVGDNELKDLNQITYRLYGQEDSNQLGIDKFIDLFKKPY